MKNTSLLAKHQEYFSHKCEKILVFDKIWNKRTKPDASQGTREPT